MNSSQFEVPPLLEVFRNGERGKDRRLSSLPHDAAFHPLGIFRTLRITRAETSNGFRDSGAAVPCRPPAIREANGEPLLLLCVIRPELSERGGLAGREKARRENSGYHLCFQNEGCGSN